jgi:sulfur carrier protein ThiS adenylyltransferase
LFTGIGPEGQRKLSGKHVLLIGAGALGTGNAEILVRAGVGKITIIDRDYVEWSNLQRQQLYDEEAARARTPKAVAAKQRLQQINSEVHIDARVLDLTLEELEAVVTNVDLIIDATDNFDTRLLINDYALKQGIPWIYGACVGSYGTTITIVPGKTPCLHCLLETIPLAGATCDTAGVISSVVQMVVAYQTAEALKLLVGDTAALHGKLIAFDLWSNQHTSIAIGNMKREQCPSCGSQPIYPYLQSAHQSKTAVLCGRDTVQIRPSKTEQRDLVEVARAWSKLDGRVESNPYLVSLTLSSHRLVLFQNGRALVHGTKDIAEARSLYYKYLG